jgi:hypothetical protein
MSRHLRDPWPNDIILDGTGMLLGTLTKDDGEDLIQTKPPGMEQVAPSSYDYSAENPAVERAQEYRGFAGGYGLKMQDGAKDIRYYYTLNADASPGSVVVKGPALRSYLPTLTDIVNGVTDFFELDHDLYALCGRYCLKRDSDIAWSVSKDFGAGQEALAAVVFHPNLDGATQCAYVALGDNQAIWKFDGTTWTQRVKEQTFTIANATDGTFALTYKGSTSAGLAYDASAADVQNVLRALHADLAACTVTKSGSTWTLTHTGKGTAGANDADLLFSAVSVTYTGTDEEALTSTTTNLVGTGAAITHATTQIAMFARAWAMVGRELYRAHDLNYLAKVDTDSDPFQERNWSAANAYRVGDHSQAIQRLVVAADGVLLAFKNDGIYTLNEYGEDQRFFPFLQMAQKGGTYAWLESLGNYGALEVYTYGELEGGVDARLAAAGYLNDVYVSYGAATFRLRTDYSLEQVGPEMLMANDSEVRGFVTALAPHQTFCLYAGLYNPDNGCSYLLKYGAWQGAAEGEGVGASKRTEAWHGSITPAFDGKRITTMYASSIGARGSHQRLYLGFSDGSVAWFALPCSASPLVCDEYRFSIARGALYLPIADMTFGSDVKLLHAYTLGGFETNADNYFTLEYRADLATSGWREIVGRFGADGAARTKRPFERNVSATYLEQAVVLHNATEDTSPQLNGLGLHYSLRPNIDPDVYEIVQMNVLIGPGLIRRDGSPYRPTPGEIKDILEAAANQAGTVTVTLPDESSCELKITGYARVTAWYDRLRKWASAYQITAVKQKVNQVYGTYARLAAAGSYGALEAYTYGELEAL